MLFPVALFESHGKHALNSPTCGRCTKACRQRGLQGAAPHAHCHVLAFNIVLCYKIQNCIIKCALT